MGDSGSLIAILESFVGRMLGIGEVHEVAQEIDAQSQGHSSIGEFMRRQNLALTVAQRKSAADAFRTFATELLARADAAEANGDKVNSVLSIPVSDPEVVAVVTYALDHISSRGSRPAKTDLLRRSCLALLVSDFEFCVARICEYVLTANPQILSFSEPRVSLEEARELGSYEAILADTIDRQVESLMHGGYDDWGKWLKKIGLDLDGSVGEHGALREVLMRRNAHVHNDGTAGKRYLAVVKPEYRQGTAIGDRLVVDTSYLQAAISTVATAGVVLGYNVGARLHSGRTDEYARAVSGLALALIEDGYAAAAVSIATHVLGNGSNLSLAVRSSLMVCRWTAARENGEFDAISQEVRDWDIEGLDESIGHQKYVLLADVEKCTKSVQRLIRDRRLTVTDIRNRIIYRPVLDDIIERIGPQIVDHNGDRGPSTESTQKSRIAAKRRPKPEQLPS